MQKLSYRKKEIENAQVLKNKIQKSPKFLSWKRESLGTNGFEAFSNPIADEVIDFEYVEFYRQVKHIDNVNGSKQNPLKSM